MSRWKQLVPRRPRRAKRPVCDGETRLRHHAGMNHPAIGMPAGVRAFILWAGLVLALLSTSLVAQASDLPAVGSTVPVKAAYILRFTQYVEWPDTVFATDRAPLVIEIDGDDELAGELARISKGHLVGNRVVEIRTSRAGGESPWPQVVYVAARDGGLIKGALEGIGSRPVLTVTDAPDSLDVGAIINFVQVGQHLRFEVGLNNAERAGLKLSARLLSVAEHVRGRAP